MITIISFDPLFDFLHFNKKQLKDLREDVNLNPRTIAKFRKGESVTLDTIDKICTFYKIPIEDVVKIIPNDKDNSK